MGGERLTRRLLAVATLLAGACAEPAPELVRLPHDPPSALLIRSTALLDVESGERLRERDVLLRGDRIAAIGEAGELPAPEGAEILDGRGATLLPGLIDAHGHVNAPYAPIWTREVGDAEHNLRAFLYCGVTTVLDPAAFSEDAASLRDRVRRGELLEAFNQPPEEEWLAASFAPYVEMLDALRPAWRSNVKLLRDAGVTILAGSDVQAGVLPGPGLHRELGLLQESGLTPAEVIRAATLDSARFLEQSEDPDFGQVKVGKRADLLLVNGDPTRDLAAVSDIREVILGGVRLERTPVRSAPNPDAD